MPSTTQPTGHNAADGTRISQPPEWPGERNPSQWDVHDAFQVPEVSFRQRFKAALLLSEDAVGCRQYLTQEAIPNELVRAASDTSLSDPMRLYNYPMATLSDIPFLLDGDDLSQPRALFFNSFKSHVFLKTIGISQPSPSQITPPYLKIALACLGTACSQRRQHGDGSQPDIPVSGNSLSSDLCLSGLRLWGVIMEVDNREARVLEAILAGSLFATYGMMTADLEFWDLSSAAMAGTATMARRVRIHHANSSAISDRILLEHNASTSSLLMSYLFLTDVVRAAHFGSIPCISSRELYMRMPSSPYNFNSIYSCLLSGTDTLPADLKSNEDSLLLLAAVCSDILCIHHTFSSLAQPAREMLGRPSWALNPYAPLSSGSEALRQLYTLDAALTNWHQHFGQEADKYVLALFYFCKLVLVLPEILCLPQLAEYPPAMVTARFTARVSRESRIHIPDEAMNFAWLILDCSNTRSDDLGANLSVWLPVVLFYAALTVWYQLREQASSSNFKSGTLKTLGMYKEELRHLPWTCCVEMCFTLDALMDG